MEDWSSWFQDVSKTWLEAKAQAKYVEPYEVQKMRFQALTQLGLVDEGAAGVYRPAAATAISPTVLLVGAVVLVGALAFAGRK